MTRGSTRARSAPPGGFDIVFARKSYREEAKFPNQYRTNLVSARRDGSNGAIFGPSRSGAGICKLLKKCIYSPRRISWLHVRTISFRGRNLQISEELQGFCIFLNVTNIAKSSISPLIFILDHIMLMFSESTHRDGSNGAMIGPFLSEEGICKNGRFQTDLDRRNEAHLARLHCTESDPKMGFPEN